MHIHEKIKKLTRGKPLDQNSYRSMVSALDLPKKDVDALLSLSPDKYLGEIEMLLGDL